MTCQSDCKVSIEANYVSEIALDNGQELQIDFGAEESKIFTFYIPASTLSQDKNNVISSVTITAASFLPGNDKILLAASTKENVVPTSASRKGVPGWRKG